MAESLKAVAESDAGKAAAQVASDVKEKTKETVAAIQKAGGEAAKATGEALGEAKEKLEAGAKAIKDGDNQIAQALADQAAKRGGTCDAACEARLNPPSKEDIARNKLLEESKSNKCGEQEKAAAIECFSKNIDSLVQEIEKLAKERDDAKASSASAWSNFATMAFLIVVETVMLYWLMSQGGEAPAEPVKEKPKADPVKAEEKEPEQVEGQKQPKEVPQEGEVKPASAVKPAGGGVAEAKEPAKDKKSDLRGGGPETQKVEVASC